MHEILILDYNRPDELSDLVDSLNRNCLFDKKIVVLNNGGKRYAYNLLEEGKVDKVINNEVNIGCGAGTVQLFSQCETEFAFYIQVDHRLVCPLGKSVVDSFEEAINSEAVFYVDLAGDQGNGKYSERAQFIRRDDYLKIPKSFGGPGPLQDLMWTEESVQKYMFSKNLDYLTVRLENGSPLFMDCGWSSVRSNPDGSEWKHEPDTKRLWCLCKPTEKFSHPKLTDKEWEIAIAGNWQDGTVPEKQKGETFEVWNKSESSKT